MKLYRLLALVTIMPKFSGICLSQLTQGAVIYGTPVILDLKATATVGCLNWGDQCGSRHIYKHYMLPNYVAVGRLTASFPICRRVMKKP